MATKYLNLSTDSTFSENSDYLIPSQKAIKTAVDSKQNKITTGDGLALSEDGQLTNTILDKTVLASNYVNPTLWKGTLAEYEALGTYDDSITYIITDDTDLEDIINDNLISKSSTYSSSKINELLSMFENIDTLPSQEGNSGKFLTTDGSVASWSEIPEQVSIDESNLVHKAGNEEITGLKTISLTTTPVALLDNNELYNEEHYVATSEIKVNDKVIKTQYSNTFEPEMLPGVKIPMNLEKIHNEFSMDTMLAKGDISHFESTSEVPMSFTKLSLEYVDTTSDTKIYDINTEIQIAAGEYKVDVTDIASNIKSGIQLNPVTKHLVLTGDATTFDANTHQDAVPTIKYVKDLLSEITTNQLNNIYPVNSLYFCTQSTCPMSTLIAGSTWEKIGSSLITDISSSKVVTNNQQIKMKNDEGEYGLIGREVTTFCIGGHTFQTGGSAVKFGSETGLDVELTTSQLSINIFKRIA